MKKILYIDMDGVLADFKFNAGKWYLDHPQLRDMYDGNADHIHGIFRYLPLIEGAKEAISKLNESSKYDMFIASTVPWDNPEGAADKRYWCEEHFGNLFYKKMIFTHRKDLLIGDYLIDDRMVNGAGNFPGKLLHFGEGNEYPNWQSVLDKLL